MADGLNDARAMRIAEVMNDFRLILARLATLQVNPPAPVSEMSAAGYAVLRESHAQAQAIVATPFQGGNLSGPMGGDENTKRSLQRILLDASARRFRAQRAFNRANAAMQWVFRRRQILNGQTPGPAHAAALRANDTRLTSDLSLITDARVYNELRARDTAAGNWLDEMADLNTLLAYVRTH